MSIYIMLSIYSKTFMLLSTMDVPNGWIVTDCQRMAGYDGAQADTQAYSLPTSCRTDPATAQSISVSVFGLRLF
ncbi:MAG: hypothetical protein JXQ90_02295 [Cyclobacteriaceae bacterium]